MFRRSGGDFGSINIARLDDVPDAKPAALPSAISAAGTMIG
jgi:hypothetical protein